MKHLYNLNSNISLLKRTPKIFITNPDVQKENEKDKDFLLLSILNMLDNETDLEPDNNLIEYLFNYSKSLDVQRLKGNKNLCLFNKN